jgi:hypothetical protein
MQWVEGRRVKFGWKLPLVCLPSDNEHHQSESRVAEHEAPKRHRIIFTAYSRSSRRIVLDQRNNYRGYHDTREDQG